MASRRDGARGDDACATCGRGPSKYTCPGCARRSCGLECVRRHKTTHACDGKRNRAAFVDIRDFGDADVVRDYRFLEEVGAEGERAKRWRPTFGDEDVGDGANRKGGRGGGGRGRGRGNGAMSQARRAMDALKAKCAERGVEVRFMANGMARRRSNTTTHHRKRDELSWRLEWVFHINSERIVRIDEKVEESSALRDAYAAHVKEMTLAVENKASMAPFKLAERDGDGRFDVVMEKFDTPANAKVWIPIDLRDTVASALRGKTVLEFPTFHVVPKTSSERDGVVVKSKS